MGVITGTVAKMTELGGDSKLYVITAPIATADDSITLTQATHGISTIEGIVGAVITYGLDAAFTAIQVSYSGLVLTVVSLEQDGTDSTAWTDTTISITLVGKSE